MLKQDWKKWNANVFDNIEHKIGDLKNKIQDLDLIDDAFGLDEGEILTRKETTTELFRRLNQRNDLHAQKAKQEWLKEGNINSKFYHRAINFRRK